MYLQFHRGSKQQPFASHTFAFDWAHHDAFQTEVRDAAPSYTLVASILLFKWPAPEYFSQFQLQPSTAVINPVHETYVRYNTPIYTRLFCPVVLLKVCNGAYIVNGHLVCVKEPRINRYVDRMCELVFKN